MIDSSRKLTSSFTSFHLLVITWSSLLLCSGCGEWSTYLVGSISWRALLSELWNKNSPQLDFDSMNLLINYDRLETVSSGVVVNEED